MTRMTFEAWLEQRCLEDANPWGVRKHQTLLREAFVAGGGGGIAHTHRWVYNAVNNAMFCDCGDRIELDHRLPAAIEAARAVAATEKTP